MKGGNKDIGSYAVKGIDRPNNLNDEKILNRIARKFQTVRMAQSNST